MQICKDCVVKITQGGGVAAPIAGQILSEVLPYLEVQKSEIAESQTISMPNVVGLTFNEANEILSDFEIEIQTDNTEEITYNDSIIYKQIPEEGVSIETGNNVILYCK